LICLVPVALNTLDDTAVAPFAVNAFPLSLTNAWTFTRPAGASTECATVGADATPSWWVCFLDALTVMSCCVCGVYCTKPPSRRLMMIIPLTLRWT